MKSKIQTVDSTKTEACVQFLESLPQIYRGRLVRAIWMNLFMPFLPPEATLTKMPHPSSVRFLLCMEQLPVIHDGKEMDRAISEAEGDIDKLARTHSRKQNFLCWIGAASQVLGVIAYSSIVVSLAFMV